MLFFHCTAAVDALLCCFVLLLLFIRTSELWAKINVINLIKYHTAKSKNGQQKHVVYFVQCQPATPFPPVGNKYGGRGPRAKEQPRKYYNNQLLVGDWPIPPVDKALHQVRVGELKRPKKTTKVYLKQCTIY